MAAKTILTENQIEAIVYGLNHGASKTGIAKVMGMTYGVVDKTAKEVEESILATEDVEWHRGTHVDVLVRIKLIALGLAKSDDFTIARGHEYTYINKTLNAPVYVSSTGMSLPFIKALHS